MAETIAVTGIDDVAGDDREVDREIDLGGAPESLRTCAATGRKLPKAGMIRFVVGPDHRPVADLEEKLPGRGIWLSAERHVIDTACRKNLFAKRARRPVEVDDGLADRVEALLVKRCQRWLELARRAHVAVGGHDEVRRRLEGKGAGKGAAGGLLLAASDGGEGGRANLARMAKGLERSAALTADEIGMPFGRERVAHVLVLAGGIRDSLGRDLMRLQGLREASLPGRQDGNPLAASAH
ncbi:MAG: DUF448 domain-containing protein [Rhodospirillaceae bacterium]